MELDILSAGFLSALFAIVLIDLVLAGDNALIIGLVARNLPTHQQRAVILWGTVGAVVVRAAMAVVVVWLLNLPGLMLAGSLALIWIARKLLTPESGGGDHAAAHAPAASLAGAIRTIVIADAVMGIDNVLAIGGAAKGSMLLVILGLPISVPLIVWGSRLVIRLVDRFPAVILAGGAVLAWTAWSMLVREPLLASWFQDHPVTRVAAAVLVFSVSLSPWYAARLSPRYQPLSILGPALMVWLMGFEVLASISGLPNGLLHPGAHADYALDALRWFGWLPLAAAFLWLWERKTAARERTRALAGA